jgi:hypothetical protein
LKLRGLSDLLSKCLSLLHLHYIRRWKTPLERVLKAVDLLVGFSFACLDLLEVSSRHKHGYAKKILVYLIKVVSFIAAVFLLFGIVDVLMVHTVVQITIIVEFILAINLSTASGKLKDHHLFADQV